MSEREDVEALTETLGWEIDGTIITRPEHDPSCEGDCRNCPIPVQDYGSIPDLARAILASSWLAAHDEAVRVSERVRLAGEVEALAAEWRADDEEHLNRFGQHLPASVVRMAELLEERLTQAGVRLTEEA